MTLLTDWQGLKAGTDDPDFFIFGDLLREYHSDEDLDMLFGDIAGGNSLIARIRQLRRENSMNGMYIIPSVDNLIGEGQARKLADSYSRTVADFLSHTAPNHAQDLLVADVQIVHDNDYFLEMAGDPALGLSEANDFVQYEFDDAMSSLGDIGFGLWEAVYGLTHSPIVTRWLLEEMVSFPMTSTAYYELWRGGGDVAFLKTCKLLLVGG